jgi:hypothetical protein
MPFAYSMQIGLAEDWQSNAEKSVTERDLSSEGGDRTPDPAVNSRLLYH